VAGTSACRGIPLEPGRQLIGGFEIEQGLAERLNPLNREVLDLMTPELSPTCGEEFLNPLNREVLDLMTPELSPTCGEERLNPLNREVLDLPPGFG
jgi:hypothetical protein